jgi:hypothetical protein
MRFFPRPRSIACHVITSCKAAKVLTHNYELGKCHARDWVLNHIKTRYFKALSILPPSPAALFDAARAEAFRERFVA